MPQTLPDFIRTNTEQILTEWEMFARSLPVGNSMDMAALRDHAKEILGVIARDLERPQSVSQETEKSQGRSDAGEEGVDTAAQEHGAGRALSGFSIEQMVAEFRALRASVIRLWTKSLDQVCGADLDALTRFNEAIDQAIAESITRFTQNIDQSRERFLAILGHDLRTPLGAIITSTQFMIDTNETCRDLQEPYLSLVTRISGSARRMNQMVSDLLDFTRTRLGDRIPIVREEMNVARMLEEVVSEVRASYPKSTIELETSGDLRGMWDCDRLAQAVTNLVGNAIQHGASPIRVAARGAPNEVLISVQNHGPLIPEEQIAQIFHAGRQSKGEPEHDDHHLGLGLYIVDQIATGHGGSVLLRSTAAEGTTFTMRLPRRVPAQATAAE